MSYGPPLRRPALAALVVLTVVAGCHTSSSPFPSDEVRVAIDRLCREAADGPATVAVTDCLLSGALLGQFYGTRGFAPAWSRDGVLLRDADSLLACVGNASEEGLRVADYHHARLAALVAAARRPFVQGENGRARARLIGSLDVLLTDAFFLYAAHLSKGKVDTAIGGARWEIAEAHPGLPAILSAALSSHTVAETLSGLPPDHDYYRGLRRARALHANELADARGKTPVSSRLREIELNMDRWRSLPHELGEPHILVDVAGFELVVVEAARPVIRTKIVVGNAAWQTRDFSSEITHVVVNPYWHAPRHVLLAELINYMRQDPNYLTSNKMTLLRQIDGREEPVDPATIDFARVDAKTLDFRLRQDPGPLNVLGRLLFRLPNPYNIYLHDTPYREDFGRTSRMFSHGCVRIEKAEDVAMFLLRREPGWNLQRLAATMAGEQERVITLAHPTRTHVAYLTAWADDAGQVRLVPDVYGRNAGFEAALRLPPRGVGRAPGLKARR